ncbi:MAG: TldD/PmbA family protein [Candidatus Micrarchaeota archaeon]
MGKGRGGRAMHFEKTAERSLGEASAAADKVAGILSLFRYADAVIGTSKFTSITLKDGKIESARVGTTESISCRMLSRGSLGFSSSNSIADYPKVIEEAKKLAGKGKGKARIASPQANRAKIPARVKRNPADYEFGEKISMLREAEKAARFGKVRNTSLTYYDTDSLIFTINSHGAFIEENDIRTGAAAQVFAKDASRIESSFEQVKERGGYEIVSNFQERARKAAREANKLLKARHGPRGKMTAILDPELAGVFSHEAVGHACEADGIKNGSSCLRGMLGKKIGSKHVTIKDSPIIKKSLWGSYAYDDEATRAKGTILVERGKLKGYLTSLESASQLGGILTGNGRGDVHSRQIVRMSNTYFEKGDAQKDELFDGIKEGIYLVGCKEGQVSPKVGNFTFAAKFGYIIRNGEEKGMVRDCSINGNILQSLHNIDMVADDLEFLPGTCGKDGQSAPVTTGSPHLRIRDILVG